AWQPVSLLACSPLSKSMSAGTDGRALLFSRTCASGLFQNGEKFCLVDDGYAQFLGLAPLRSGARSGDNTMGLAGDTTGHGGAESLQALLRLVPGHGLQGAGHHEGESCQWQFFRFFRL